MVRTDNAAAGASMKTGYEVNPVASYGKRLDGPRGVTAVRLDSGMILGEMDSVKVKFINIRRSLDCKDV